MTEPKIIMGDLPKTEVFTATLELRSVGNSINIIPEIKWSHQLEGDLEARAEGNQIPYAYISMMRIAEAMKSVMKPVNVMVEAALPEDPDEAAVMIDAIQSQQDHEGGVN